jgi:hypothetical protein
LADSAKGVRGFILSAGFNKPPLTFRVYNPDGSFTDYDLKHMDLEVEIVSEDAVFTENGRLDYHPKVLGKEHAEKPHLSKSRGD